MLDVNADVGEGFPYDRELMSVISSANVACGFHAGDAATMGQVCGWAVERGVVIGAQPSYLDREGFGRRPMDVGRAQLHDWLVDQVEALRRAAADVGATVAYVKPHGALYNRVVTDTDQAGAVVDVCAELQLPVLGLPGSEVLRLAAARGLPCVREFFADRAYDEAGHLVPRTADGAVVHDPDEVAARVTRLVRHQTVETVAGATVLAEADSVCVHGDTPDALGLARRVVDAIVAAGGTVGAAV